MFDTREQPQPSLRGADRLLLVTWNQSDGAEGGTLSETKVVTTDEDRRLHQSRSSALLN